MKTRKNDKAYLQDLKIDIRTKSDINYQELALLFDKPAFLNMLPALRREYGFVNLISFDECEDFDVLWELDSKGFTKINLSKYTKIENLKKSFPSYYDYIKGSDNAPIIFENECYLLCYEFSRPPYFFNAIEESIYCGIVTNKNFKPTKATIIEPNSLWFGDTLPPIAIFVSPTSTYEDVKEEFRKAKELMKTDKRVSYYQPRTDLTPNIRKYREWYWERIKGKTYQQISNEWEKKHNNETESTTYLDVLKAVKIYEKLLAS